MPRVCQRPPQAQSSQWAWLIGRPQRSCLLIMRDGGHRGGMSTFVVLSGSAETARAGAMQRGPSLERASNRRRGGCRLATSGQHALPGSLLAMACRLASHARLAVAPGLLPDELQRGTMLEQGPVGRPGANDRVGCGGVAERRGNARLHHPGRLAADDHDIGIGGFSPPGGKSRDT